MQDTPNSLIDKFPTITPHGFEIDTSFRTSIKFELLMQDNEIPEEEKTVLALNLYYDSIINPQEQITDLVWFYSGGKTQQKEEKQEKPIYSFDYDADLIYCAFLTQYGINLQKVNLHWWEFRALFSGLTEQNKIVEIMGIRALNLGEIKDKEQKAYYKKLKRLYKLPDMRTQEQKEADFGSVFW